MSDLSNIPKQSYFSAQLESPIDSSQTTGITLTAVPDFTPAGETIYFNILDANSVETISATGWTGTTLTGATRAVATYSGETATGYAHAAGITVVLSDDWKYFEAVQTAVNSKADSAGDTFTGSVDFSGASTTFRIPNLTEAQRDALGSPANGMLVYNTTAGEFQYYDGGAWASVGTASVPNASTTVAGIIELATAAERAAGTATGGTGATLVPTNDALVKTSSGAGDENKIAILDSAGKFAQGFIDATATPTASKIPIADGSGKLAEGWLQMTDAQATTLTDTSFADSLHLHLTRVATTTDTLQQSADTERDGSGITSYTKVKEIQVNLNGRYRVKFDLKRGTDGTGPPIAYGKIYKNGVAYGTERTNNTNTYQTFSEDLLFSAGDLVQLYYYSSDGGSANRQAITRNFRLYYTVSSAADTEVIID